LEQVHFEAGAAGIGAVEEARLYAEIFGDRQGWKSMRAGSGEDRIDIRQRETGIPIAASAASASSSMAVCPGASPVPAEPMPTIAVRPRRA
jgi:hypothetical protein